jgi:RluA family pseudouridine synthase
VRKLSTSAADAGATLAAWLAGRLALPAEAAAALVAAGSVYVDGRRVRDPSLSLSAGQKIGVHEAAAPPPPTFREVYSDAEVVVVDKPAGVAVMATREAAGALDEAVAAAHPGVRPVHRIDRDTSGLVLFARCDPGPLGREYLAVVAGAPPAPSFVLDAPIGPDPRDRRRFAAGAGRPAETRLRVAGAWTGGALLRATLVTGRTHQIRVHLAAAGLPILGDPIYAPPAARARAPRLALHAAMLRFGGREVSSPLPPELRALLPIAIRPISAAETRPLRRSVLRPHQTEAELAYAGDDAPATLHLGAFLGDALVGVASIYREPPPSETDPGDWRLRGMATAPEIRGTGAGALLLQRCLDHARAAGGTRFWCNARTPAAGFYRRHGLETRGEAFDLPGIGPHFFMWRKL